MTFPLMGARITLSAALRILPWALFVSTVIATLIALNGFGVKLPLVGFVGIEGKNPKIARLEKEIQSIFIAQDQAEEAQKTVNATAEAIYAGVAERIEEDAQMHRRVALDATNRFIAANRVRANFGSQPCQTPAPAGGGGPADPLAGPVVPELAGVLVSERDIRICEENNIRAIAGNSLATKLKAVEVPVPGGQGDTNSKEK